MNNERILWQKQQERIRPVGRPAVNPFHNPLVEEDFYQRAIAVVKRFYDFAPENTKKPFVLSTNCHMGKTAFWAFIYFYYTIDVPFCYPIPKEIFPNTQRPLISNNLESFLNLLKEKVGDDVVGGRPAIAKKVSMLKVYPIHTDTMTVRSTMSLREQTDKLRRQYRLVVKIWNDVL